MTTHKMQTNSPNVFIYIYIYIYGESAFSTSIVYIPYIRVGIYICMYNEWGVFKVFSNTRPFPRIANSDWREQQWGSNSSSSSSSCNSNSSTPKTCLKVKRDLQHVRQQFAGIVWKGQLPEGGVAAPKRDPDKVCEIV